MNVFALLLFWVASVCGLAAFRAVEAKAGFWTGSAAFVAVAGGAWAALQFWVKMFSKKPRGDGGTAVPGAGGEGTSDKEQK